MLALVTEAWGGRGGIAQYNQDLLSALAASKAVGQIEVLPRFTVDPAKGLPSGLVQHRARPGKMTFAAEAVRQAFALKPEILFCGHLNMVPMCHLIAQATGARLVIQLHGIETWKPPTALQRLGLEQATLVLCVSRYTRGEVLKYANIPRHRIRVHANTYSDDFVLGDRDAARRRFEVPENAFCLLSVSRLDCRERYKGHERIIAALPTLHERNPNVLYLIAGEGNDSPRLQSLARSVGVSESVRFLGHVPREWLPDLYRAADLFALPSTGEGFGIAFLEAMACGTPAIGLGVAGANDALADGELGKAPGEDEFLQVLVSAVAARRRPSLSLAGAVASRYGRQSFAAHATAVFDFKD